MIATARPSNILADEPEWLSYERLIRLHRIQMELFGGVAGIKDHGLVEGLVDGSINEREFAEDIYPWVVPLP